MLKECERKKAEDSQENVKGDRTHFIVMVYCTEPLNEQAGEGSKLMEEIERLNEIVTF